MPNQCKQNSSLPYLLYNLQAAKVADEVVTAVKSVKEKVEKLRSAKENKIRVSNHMWF